MRTTDHYTIDIDTPELEAKLTSGGFGESGYDQTSLVAVEVVVPNDRVEGRDAALSRRVPSHDGLCGNGSKVGAGETAMKGKQ
jgi:hypothetical protein